MVLIGAAFGVGWETGLLNRVSGQFFDRAASFAACSGRSLMAAVAG